MSLSSVGLFLLFFIIVGGILSAFVLGFGTYLVVKHLSARGKKIQQPVELVGALASPQPLDAFDISDIPVSTVLPAAEGQPAWSRPMPSQQKRTAEGTNYSLFRPNADFENRFKGVFVKRPPVSWSERQVYDALFAWVWDDVNTRYGDRFTLLAKVPLRNLVKNKGGSLPLELRNVLMREVDFVVCARGHKLKPVLAITIWAGSIAQGEFSSVLLPDRVVEHRELTPVEWEQWIGAGLLQIAGIHSYLVSEKMALDWARVCRDFLTQLEVDLGDALKDSDVYGIE